MGKIASHMLQATGLIAINVLFFTCFDELSLTRWICWAYIHLTYVLIIAAAYSSKSAKDGHIYAYPKIAVASIYFIVALVTGAIIMIINFESPVVPIVVFLIFTGGYLKIYLTLMATETVSMANTKRDTVHVLFIKKCSERLSIVRSGMTDFEQKKIVERAYDAIRNAQISSVPAVAVLEVDIENAVDAIESAVNSNDKNAMETAVRKMITLIRKRDAEIRLAQ